MVTAHAKPVLPAQAANIATMAVAAAFVPAPKLKPTPANLVCMWANARRPPKKEPGVKEVPAAMAIAGSMGKMGVP